MADLLTKALNPTGMSLEEIEHQVTTCTGFVKLIMGMANNCAYGVMIILGGIFLSFKLCQEIVNFVSTGKTALMVVTAA